MIQHFASEGIKEIAWDKTCTSLPMKWHEPRGSKITPAPVMNISFANTAVGDRKRNPVQCSLYEARATEEARCHTAGAITWTKETFSRHKNTPISYLAEESPADVATPFGTVPLGSVLSYQLRDRKPSSIFSFMLPNPLPTQHDISPNFDLPTAIIPPDSTIPQQYPQTINHIETLLVPSLTDAQAKEKMTVQQSLSDEWKEGRKNRLTASHFGQVMKRKAKPSPSFMKEVMGSVNLSNVTSVSYGSRYESVAKEQYLKLMKKKAKHPVTLYECGLVVNPGVPWLGASPDGKVYDPVAEDPYGLLEIKCPYKYRDSTPEQACENSDFCCTIVDNVITLKKDHIYYMQIQGQIALSKVLWCDFVVFTQMGLHVSRIEYDEQMWRDTCYPTLTKFYFEHCIPFIANRTSNDDTAIPDTE